MLCVLLVGFSACLLQVEHGPPRAGQDLAEGHAAQQRVRARERGGAPQAAGLLRDRRARAQACPRTQAAAALRCAWCTLSCSW